MYKPLVCQNKAPPRKTVPGLYISSVALKPSVTEHPLLHTDLQPRGYEEFGKMLPRCRKILYWGGGADQDDAQDNLSESRFRVVQCYNDPTNDCGSGSDM